MKKTMMFIILMIAFLCGCVFHSLITYVPKDAQTVSRLLVLEQDIRAYYAQKGVLPKKLSDVVDSQIDDNKVRSLKNAWGYPIEDVVLEGTSGVLKTYGKSGSNGKVKQEFVLQFDVRE